MKKFNFLKVVSIVLTLVMSLGLFAGCTETPAEKATLTGIAITAAPTKTEYTEGETFDKTGMVVTATYSDNTKKAVTSYTVAPDGKLTKETDSVVITYKEGDVTKTATQKITVKAAAALASIAITTPPTKTEYTVGETFDKTGMVVTATYSDNSTKTVTSFYWTPTEALTKDITSIEIGYKEGEITKTTTQAITVKDAVLSALTITAQPTKLTYKLGETLDTTGLAVQGVYNNGQTVSVSLDDCIVEPSGALGVNDTVVKVSYKNDKTVKPAYLNRKIVIEAPEIASSDVETAKTIYFKDTADYTLEGGASKSTWSSDGNTFDRLRVNKKVDAHITFSYDYSSLADKSLAAVGAIMSAARGGSVVEISVDNGTTWQKIAEAGEGLNMLTADYKYPSSTIDGKKATDGANRNVYYCYWAIGKYLTAETTVVKVRFSYEDPTNKGWVGVDTEGSDLMHAFTFYNKIDFAKLTGKVKLESVAVKTNSTKTTYTEGDLFDVTGLVLTATWSDGSTTEISSGFTVTPSTTLTTSDTSVTISYTFAGVTKSVEIPVTVNALQAEIVSIAVTTNPTKTVYTEGETFSADGMVVTATYSDNTTKVVTGYTVTPDGALTSDVTSVTVTYMEKTTTLSIRVLQSALKAEDKVVAQYLSFTNADNYTLSTGATVGAARTFNDGTDTSAVRLRANKNTGAYIQVSYTFANDVDLTKAGFMFYGLAGRLATVIKISTDGENFTNLFKIASSETKYILSDWREKADNIVNAGKTDANMYAMYYDISTYIATSKTVYIRFGYEAIPDGVTAVDKEGADIFGGVTFYSKLDLCKVKA